MQRRHFTRTSASLLGLSLLFLLLGAACQRNDNAADLPSFDSGGKLYSDRCASCHGDDGAGGKLVGGAISSDLRAQRLGDAYGSNIALMRRAVLDGKGVTGADLDPGMPRFRGKISEADATNIIVYLESLRAPPVEAPPTDENGNIIVPGQDAH